MNKPKERTLDVVFREIKKAKTNLNDLEKEILEIISKKYNLKKKKDWKSGVFDCISMSKTHSEFENMLNSRWGKWKLKKLTASNTN